MDEMLSMRPSQWPRSARSCLLERTYKQAVPFIKATTHATYSDTSCVLVVKDDDRSSVCPHSSFYFWRWPLKDAKYMFVRLLSLHTIWRMCPTTEMVRFTNYRSIALGDPQCLRPLANSKHPSAIWYLAGFERSRTGCGTSEDFQQQGYVRLGRTLLDRPAETGTYMCGLRWPRRTSFPK